MVTAADAYFGGSITATPSTTYRLRLPYGPGGCRFYDLTPSAAIDVTLPDARLLRTGAPVYRILNQSGTHQITAKDSTGTTVAAIAAGELYEIGCRDNTTAGGLWYVFGHLAADVTVGGALTIGRQPWTITLDSQILNWNLRQHLDSRGYPGVDPVAVTLDIATTAIIGSATTATAALDTGTFPSGSTLLLVNRGLIVGKGGDGGRGGGAGGFSDGPEAGDPGGIGLYCRMTTRISNHGTIAGGGGGGGGGTGDITSTSSPAGGGGGGGCGYLGGQGGDTNPPYPTANMATPGLAGGLYVIGAGGLGHNAGGSGGALGSAGAAGAGSGGAGGAAGSSITRLSAATVTKIRTGTISGPEVAV